MIFRRKEKIWSQGIVDIHSHILPGLDDGAADPSETLAMLRMAASEGITAIIATPHFNMDRYSAPPRKVMRALEEARGLAEREKIPVSLYPGNEISYFEGLAQALEEGRACTLNEGEYVLIEFSPSVMFRYLQNAMDSIMGAGYRPILAHAERYGCLVEEEENAGLLRHMGVEIQVNASSVTGKNGGTAKRFVHRLLEEGLAGYVGTDAHGREHRRPEIARCREALLKRYGKAYTEALLWGNAGKLLKASEK